MIKRLVDEYMEEHSRPYRYEIDETFYVGDLIHCVVSEYSPHGELDVTYTLLIKDDGTVSVIDN